MIANQLYSSIYIIARFYTFGTFCSFKDNTQRLSLLMRDEFLKGQDIAVYWIEHVIRFNGTKHLKPTSQNIPFCQLYLLDVGLFLVVFTSIIFGIVLYMVQYIIRCLLTNLRNLKKVPFSNSKKTS